MGRGAREGEIRVQTIIKAYACGADAALHPTLSVVVAGWLGVSRIRVTDPHGNRLNAEIYPEHDGRATIL